jgi:hypothetical protein
MKKLFVFALMAVLLVSAVMAASSEPKNDNTCNNQWFCNQEIMLDCQNFFNDTHYYTIATASFDGTAYNLDNQNTLYRYYKLDVTGTSNSAAWTSTPPVKSVLVKTEAGLTAFEGGLSGSAESTGINQVIFCGYKHGGSHTLSNNGGNNNSNGVPEFPALTVIVAVLVVTLGLVFLRKN